MGCTGKTNLSQEEQRCGKISRNFLLQVKAQLLLSLCSQVTIRTVSFELHSHSAKKLCSFYFAEPPRHLTLQIDLIESSDLLVGSGGKDLNQDALFCPGALPGHKKRTRLPNNCLVARKVLLDCWEEAPSLPASLHGSRTLQAG